MLANEHIMKKSSENESKSKSEREKEKEKKHIWFPS